MRVKTADQQSLSAEPQRQGTAVTDMCQCGAAQADGLWRSGGVIHAKELPWQTHG